MKTLEIENALHSRLRRYCDSEGSKIKRFVAAALTVALNAVEAPEGDRKEAGQRPEG